MCNVLLAWANLQQPYITKSLSIPSPKNPNNWVHLVIFKLQPKIQLTHSLYKVTCLSWISNPFFKDFSLLIITYIIYGQMLISLLIFDIYFCLLLMYQSTLLQMIAISMIFLIPLHAKNILMHVK